MKHKKVSVANYQQEGNFQSVVFGTPIVHNATVRVLQIDHRVILRSETYNIFNYRYTLKHELKLRFDTYP